MALKENGNPKLRISVGKQGSYLVLFGSQNRIEREKIWPPIQMVTYSTGPSVADCRVVERV
jgi:hypothetical protein